MLKYVLKVGKFVICFMWGKVFNVLSVEKYVMYDKYKRGRYIKGGDMYIIGVGNIFFF